MADIFNLSKISYVVVFGASISNFASGIIEPTVAPYLEILGNSNEQIGRILSMRWLLVAIMSIPFALLSTRIGEVNVLQISAIFLTAAGFVLLFIEGSDGVYFFSILIGLSSASSSGPGAAILAENPGNKRVAAFALFSISWMIPPALGSAVSAFWFRNTIEYTVSGLSSIFIVVFYSVLVTAFGYIIILNRMKSNRISFREKKMGLVTEFRVLFAPIIALPLFFLMAVNFLAGAGAGATLPFLPPYLKSLGATPTQISLLVLMLNLLMGVASQLVTPLVKRFGELRIYAITTTLSTLFLVSLVYTEELNTAALFYIFRGTFANMNAPISQSRVLSYIDPRVRATGSAMASNIRWVGWVIFSPISGGIIDTHGYQISFVFTAAIYIVSMLLFIWTVSTKPDLERLNAKMNTT